MIRAAAPTEDAELRKLGSELRVPGAEVRRISLVELGGFVKLGMALGGGIGANAADPVLHGSPASSTRSKCVG